MSCRAWPINIWLIDTIVPVIWAPTFKMSYHDRNTKNIFSQEYAKGESLGIVTLASLLILLKTLTGVLTGAISWRPHTFFFIVLVICNRMLCKQFPQCWCCNVKTDFSSRLRDINYRPWHLQVDPEYKASLDHLLCQNNHSKYTSKYGYKAFTSMLPQVMNAGLAANNN